MPDYRTKRQKLQDLINHPRTSEPERNAARLALERLGDKPPERSSSTAPPLSETDEPVFQFDIPYEWLVRWMKDRGVDVNGGTFTFRGQHTGRWYRPTPDPNTYRDHEFSPRTYMDGVQYKQSIRCQECNGFKDDPWHIAVVWVQVRYPNGEWRRFSERAVDWELVDSLKLQWRYVNDQSHTYVGKRKPATDTEQKMTGAAERHAKRRAERRHRRC